MNLETGEIIPSSNFEESELRRQLANEELMLVDSEDMTEKQKAENQVSLHDHRSILGKKLTKNRKRKLKRKGLLS